MPELGARKTSKSGEVSKRSRIVPSGKTIKVDAFLAPQTYSRNKETVVGDQKRPSAQGRSPVSTLAPGVFENKHSVSTGSFRRNAQRTTIATEGEDTA